MTMQKSVDYSLNLVSGISQLQSFKLTHRQPCLTQPTHVHPSLTQQTHSGASAIARQQTNKPCQLHPVTFPSLRPCPSQNIIISYWSRTTATEWITTLNSLSGPVQSHGASCSSLISGASVHIYGIPVKPNFL